MWEEFLLRKTVTVILRSSGRHLGPSYETSTPKLHSGVYPDTTSGHGGGTPLQRTRIIDRQLYRRHAHIGINTGNIKVPAAQVPSNDCSTRMPAASVASRNARRPVVRARVL